MELTEKELEQITGGKGDVVAPPEWNNPHVPKGISR